jgi:hypothetical protein
MNQFVNLAKRSVALPGGCQDLIDVLNRAIARKSKQVRWFVEMLLSQGEMDRAKQLVVGMAQADGKTPVRYLVDSIWYDLAPFPSAIRPKVITVLMEMAKLPAGQLPAMGTLEVAWTKARSRWQLAIPDADGECMLNRIED